MGLLTLWKSANKKIRVLWWFLVLFCFALFCVQRADLPVHHCWEYWQLGPFIESVHTPFLRTCYIQGWSRQRVLNALRPQFKTALYYDCILVWLLVFLPDSFTPSLLIQTALPTTTHKSLPQRLLPEIPNQIRSLLPRDKNRKLIILKKITHYNTIYLGLCCSKWLVKMEKAKQCCRFHREFVLVLFIVLLLE